MQKLDPSSHSNSIEGMDRTVMINNSKNRIAVKSQLKKAKAIVLKNLLNMAKIKNSNENMMIIFYNYMKSVIEKI